MGTIGWGVSLRKNPRRAGQEAAMTAVAQLGGDRCHSCLVFCTVGYPQQTVLDSVRAETGSVPMIGCSGSGVIAPGVADESNHALLVLAIADHRIRLATSGYPRIGHAAEAARAVGTELGRSLADDTRFALLLPCGLNVVADEFLACFEQEMGRPLPILGGTAGENWRWEKTYQYHDWKVYEGGVSAALVSGDFGVRTAVTHGCLPVGNELEITKVDGNRLYEINNRPAMDVMAEYVGEDIWTDFGKVAVHFCLGQPVNPNVARNYDPYIIRFIPKGYPEDKSISLPVRMDRGDRVWMTRRDQQKMSESAQRSVKELRQELGESIPFLVLHFDCAGRGKVVLSESDKLGLITSLQTGIGSDVPWAGFFSYGEFCPVGGRNMFHNYTAVIAALF